MIDIPRVRGLIGEPIRRRLTPGANGYLAELTLPVRGKWRISADALVNDFERVRFSTEISVGR